MASTPKYLTFITNLQTVVQTKGRNSIKTTIGDSTFNNRVLTINQVIRYLTRRNATTTQRQLGKQLRKTYSLLKEDLHFNRALGAPFRTDAFDINEFFTVYTNLVVNSKSHRLRVSRNLAA